jgi:hypothetical protein
MVLRVGGAVLVAAHSCRTGRRGVRLLASRLSACHGLAAEPPASPPPCATAVAAPVINNDATPRNRIVFVMEVFVIKIAPAMLG